MSIALPNTAQEFMSWSWAQIKPHFDDLAARPLSADNGNAWLTDWSRLSEMLAESYSRLAVATSQDTTDKAAEKRYFDFLDNIYQPAEAASQKLKEKLLASGLQPEGFEVPLRNIRAEAELYREENLPLLTQERKLGNEYDRIRGAQTVDWEGKETTLSQLMKVFQNPDRTVRERAWRMAAERQLQDREAINALWVKFMDLRRQLAGNADLTDYRAYRWRQMLRFDYTPDDCKHFHAAIENVVTPAATRVYQRLAAHEGVQATRPWDLGRDDYHMVSRPPLHPYDDLTELEDKASTIFTRVDPQLGGYFKTMRDEHLLDLPNRKGKGPGAYCTSYDVLRRPFVFMNAVGIHGDVQTLLHETGHAFHVFETARLPYHQQLQITMEIAEVASMSMELLGAPYLTAAQGGFYSESDAARARVEHLEDLLLFWPYMAVVDAFQHWVYENSDAASDPANCDRTWAGLWGRFIPGIDWSGLDQELMTGWHRKLHIHTAPMYYVEYGLAQLGAVQVWRNSLSDQTGAVRAYRKALSLGGTRPLPELFAAAGAKFAFDADTLKMAVDLIEKTIDELNAVAK